MSFSLLKRLLFQISFDSSFFLVSDADPHFRIRIRMDPFADPHHGNPSFIIKEVKLISRRFATTDGNEQEKPKMLKNAKNNCRVAELPEAEVFDRLRLLSFF